MNRHPQTPITEQDLETFERDGVVCLRQIFDRDWADRMRDASIRYMESGQGRTRVVDRPDETGKFYSNVFMCMGDDDFMTFRNESPIAEVAATLMGADKVRFWYDQLFIKEPQTVAPTQWHHDLPFWPFLGNDIISIWVALTPASRETSGLVYLGGSHKWGKFYRPVTPDEDPAFANPDLEPCPDFSERFDDPSLRFLSWDMEPGDCICHHPLTVHGAGGNASKTQRRIGLSLRFFGNDAVYDPKPYTVKLPVEPSCPPGAYPDDDSLFPVVWDRDRVAA